MDRGRPRNRNERKDVTKPKTAEASMEKSAERQAFEELPKGFLPKDAFHVPAANRLGFGVALLSASLGILHNRVLQDGAGDLGHHSLRGGRVAARA